MAATLYSFQSKAIQHDLSPFYRVENTPLDDRSGTAIAAFDIVGRAFPPGGTKGRSEGTTLGSSNKHRLHSSVLISPPPSAPIYTLRKPIPCVFSALCTRDQSPGPYPRIRILSRGGRGRRTPDALGDSHWLRKTATVKFMPKLHPHPTRSPAIALQTLRNRLRLSDVTGSRGLLRALPSPEFHRQTAAQLLAHF